jgi:hypothetical protein
MAASLLHAAAAAPSQPARTTFHPLASAPVSLRLARASSSSRRRLEASFRALSAGHRLAGRPRRVVAAFAGEETVSQPSLSEILARAAVSAPRLFPRSQAWLFRFRPTDPRSFSWSPIFHIWKEKKRC